MPSLRKIALRESVQIESFFWSLFSCIRTKYRKIRTRKNSVFGHFSRSVNNDYFKQLHFTFIHNYLNYADIAWSCAHKT